MQAERASPKLMLSPKTSHRRRSMPTHLLGDDGKKNTVELIKAAPQPALAQALEDLGAVRVLLLVREGGHHHEDTEGPAQIFHRLGLACACGPRGCPTKVHAQRLCQCDVASVSQWRDDQTLLRTEILVLRVEIHVRDADDTGPIRGALVRGIEAPVEPRLWVEKDAKGSEKLEGGSWEVEKVEPMCSMRIAESQRLPKVMNINKYI